MFMLFGIGIAVPWMLAGLLLLPVIYLLLRLMPIRPQVVSFPPMRLLLDLKKQEETPVRSPWWQTLMRLLAAAAIILALAEPIWRPVQDALSGRGPIWILVDNSWASAKGWQARAERLDELVSRAERVERPVLLLTTTSGPDQTNGLISPSEARQKIAALQPMPWSSERGALAALLSDQAEDAPPAKIHWLSDGLSGPDDTEFLTVLQGLAGAAEVSIYQDLDRAPLALLGAENRADAIVAKVARSSTNDEMAAQIIAYDLAGNLVGDVPVTFEPDAMTSDIALVLPLELRNDIARLEISGERSAGSLFLVDDQWQRRRVGILAGTQSDQAQPLLSSEYYLTRALAPYATLLDTRTQELAAATTQLIEDGASLIVLADVASVATGPATDLLEWVANGGMLVRFAVSGLDGAQDGLLPVDLRSGARDLGGTLTWSEPQQVGMFKQDGPFSSLSVPDDVTVTRQVLAQPSSDLIEKTWVQLTDGTPLVTGERIGAGWLVLFHVPADTSWSTLPLSGAFVEMLNELIAMSRASRVNRSVATASADQSSVASLPPLRLLDGYGQFGGQYADAEPLSADLASDAVANATRPPGLYGTENGFRALNVHSTASTIAPFELGALEAQATLMSYERSSARDLAPYLFVGALLILLLDGVIVLFLSGTLRLGGRMASATTAVFVVLVAASVSEQAKAQGALSPAEAVSVTRLAYVITGNAEIDNVSARGLIGLTQFLTRKTALEPGDPVGIDVASDELVYYPLLYWPIDPSAEQLDSTTIDRIDTYMRTGGTILFDTRDSLEGISFDQSGSAAIEWLRTLLQTVDVPPLEPVPFDHVVTKTFYLLDDFPGRYADGELWIEALEASAASGRPVRSSDGVSPLLITGNDLAGAWAVDDERRPLFPTIPSDSFQRELAYRVGVNIVMYTLTGNYKADQVHVPALLERLGQ